MGHLFASAVFSDSNPDQILTRGFITAMNHSRTIEVCSATPDARLAFCSEMAPRAARSTTWSGTAAQFAGVVDRNLAICSGFVVVFVGPELTVVVVTPPAVEVTAVLVAGSGVSAMRYGPGFFWAPRSLVLSERLSAWGITDLPGHLEVFAAVAR